MNGKPWDVKWKSLLQDAGRIRDFCVVSLYPDMGLIPGDGLRNR